MLLRPALCAGAYLLFFTGIASAQLVASFGTQFTGRDLSLPLILSSQRDEDLRTPLLPLPEMPSVKPRQVPDATWKSNITATVFWVGEEASKRNPVSNIQSSWDSAWMTNFGGFDDPAGRSTSYYGPASFIPKQNPFYVALPYNDVVNSAQTKSEAAKCIPWFKTAFKKQGQSVCRDHWIALRYHGRVCYAQWCDCGPFVTNDADYVFGSKDPVNTQNGGAGIDMSPAVRDYLNFPSGEKCDWRFVEVEEVDEGPWKNFGANNPFAQSGSEVWNTPTPFVPGPMDAPSMEPIGSGLPVEKASVSKVKALAPSSLSGTARMAELKKQRAAWFGDSSKKAR